MDLKDFFLRKTENLRRTQIIFLGSSTTMNAPTKNMKTKTGRTVKAVSKKSPTLNRKVATLAQAVKKLNAVSYDKVSFRGFSEDASVIQPFYQFHINAETRSWTPVFGHDAADVDEVNKVYVNSYTVEARLRQGSEADLIYYSAFVVSLKDQGADSSTFNQTTGALTLADSVHYTTLGAQGKVLVSKKFFNIHSYKRFYMGGRIGDQSAPVLRDLTFKIKPKQRLIENPRGNMFGVGGLVCPKDPSQNYYLLLFCDDSSLDIQVNTLNVSVLVDAAIPS